MIKISHHKFFLKSLMTILTFVQSVQDSNMTANTKPSDKIPGET